MQKDTNTELTELLNGNSNIEDEPLFDHIMLAQIHFPEIAAELGQFKSDIQRRAEIVDEIDELKAERDKLDERIKDTAEELQQTVYKL